MNLPIKIDLSGKVAVVTGAGGVLCSSFAEALAECGAKVAVYDKQVVMYGGEGNVSVYTSDTINNSVCADLPASAFTNNPANTPKVVLEVAPPIVLSVKLADRNWRFGFR